MNSNVRRMTESAILVAMAVVLNLVGFKIWPNGGSITLVSMAPIVILSLRNGIKWGLLGGVAYSLIQMMTGFYPPPVETAFWYFVVVALDYIVPFTVLGAACLFSKLGKGNMRYGIAAAVVTSIRYICHIISGVAVWGVYAPEDTSVFVYSLTYNGSYMVPEIILTTIAVVGLMGVLERVESKAFA